MPNTITSRLLLCSVIRSVHNESCSFENGQPPSLKSIQSKPMWWMKAYSGGFILTGQYFEKYLEHIREIRLSEIKLLQKITDIFATSIDYDLLNKRDYSEEESLRTKCSVSYK